MKTGLEGQEREVVGDLRKQGLSDEEIGAISEELVIGVDLDPNLVREALSAPRERTREPETQDEVCLDFHGKSIGPYTSQTKKMKSILAAGILCAGLSFRSLGCEPPLPDYKKIEEVSYYEPNRIVYSEQPYSSRKNDVSFEKVIGDSIPEKESRGWSEFR